MLARDDIYLANHSLGRPLDRTAEDVKQALDLWYSRMDECWEAAGWLDEVNRWRANTARLIGLSRPDCIVPKTSAGQGLRAVLNAFPQDRPVKVVTTRGEFDSIDFILKTYASRGRADVTWIEPDSRGLVPMYSVEPLIAALSPTPNPLPQRQTTLRDGAPEGLVVVSLVFFQTAQILQNLERLIAAAHDRGWLVLLDLYHAAGVIPLEFEKLGADFAIGGSYKYMRGGPGACWLALHPRHASSNHLEEGGLRTLDTGWFAKKNTFGYERSDTPEFAEGGNGWLESTPPVITAYQAKAGIEFALEIGADELRKKNLAQQALMRNIFRGAGVALIEAEDPTRFGAFSLLRNPDAAALGEGLKRRKITVDARGEFVRFGPDLLNTQDEFERAAQALKELLL